MVRSVLARAQRLSASEACIGTIVHGGVRHDAGNAREPGSLACSVLSVGPDQTRPSMVTFGDFPLSLSQTGDILQLAPHNAKVSWP